MSYVYMYTHSIYIYIYIFIYTHIIKDEGFRAARPAHFYATARRHQLAMEKCEMEPKSRSKQGQLTEA